MAANLLNGKLWNYLLIWRVFGWRLLERIDKTDTKDLSESRMTRQERDAFPLSSKRESLTALFLYHRNGMLQLYRDFSPEYMSFLDYEKHLKAQGHEVIEGEMNLMKRVWKFLHVNHYINPGLRSAESFETVSPRAPEAAFPNPNDPKLKLIPRPLGALRSDAFPTSSPSATTSALLSISNVALQSSLKQRKENTIIIPAASVSSTDESGHYQAYGWNKPTPSMTNQTNHEQPEEASDLDDELRDSLVGLLQQRSITRAASSPPAHSQPFGVATRGDLLESYDATASSSSTDAKSPPRPRKSSEQRTMIQRAPVFNGTRPKRGASKDIEDAADGTSKQGLKVKRSQAKKSQAKKSRAKKSSALALHQEVGSHVDSIDRYVDSEEEEEFLPRKTRKRPSVTPVEEIANSPKVRKIVASEVPNPRLKRTPLQYESSTTAYESEGDPVSIPNAFRAIAAASTSTISHAAKPTSSAKSNAAKKASIAAKKTFATAKKAAKNAAAKKVASRAVLPSVPTGSPRVAIIGAGIAGLAAAKALTQSATCEVVVFESRSRIGGRIQSVSVDNNVVDLGAQFTANHPSNALLQLFNQVGLEMRSIGGENAITGEVEFIRIDRVDGPLLNTEISTTTSTTNIMDVSHPIGNGFALQNGQQSAITTPPARKQTVRPRKHPKPIDGASVSNIMELTDVAGQLKAVLRGNLFQSSPLPFQVSAVPSIGIDTENSSQLDGKGVIFLEKGMMEIVRALAEGVNIRFDCSVQSISATSSNSEQTDKSGPQDPFLVQFKDGASPETSTLEGFDAVIVAVPLGILKRGDIAFNPSLPPSKRDAIARVAVGHQNKIVLLFEKAFWLPQSNSIVCQDLSLGLTVSSALASYDSPMLEVYWCGDSSCHMNFADPEDFVRQILEKIPRTSEPRVKSFMWAPWSADSHCYGAHSYLPRGEPRTIRDMLAAPLHGGKLAFAGEHTSISHPSTILGAYESGIREAKRIIDSFANRQ